MSKQIVLVTRDRKRERLFLVVLNFLLLLLYINSSSSFSSSHALVVPCGCQKVSQLDYCWLHERWDKLRERKDIRGYNEQAFVDPCKDCRHRQLFMPRSSAPVTRHDGIDACSNTWLSSGSSFVDYHHWKLFGVRIPHNTNIYKLYCESRKKKNIIFDLFEKYENLLFLFALLHLLIWYWEYLFVYLFIFSLFLSLSIKANSWFSASSVIFQSITLYQPTQFIFFFLILEKGVSIFDNFFINLLQLRTIV